MTTTWRGVAAIVAAVGVVAAVAPAAPAAGIGKRRAAALAQRRRAGGSISYPPSLWKAACDGRIVGGWRCEAGTRGECAGVVTVTGTSGPPRVRMVRVSCFG